MAIYRTLFSLFALFLLVSTGFGQEGRVAKYPLAKPPLEIYELLNKADLGKVEPFSDGNQKLLADFWAAREPSAKREIPQADDSAVAMHLMASGVFDPEKRAKYLRKFNELVEASKTAVAEAKTDSKKADALLRFLHNGVMAKGYDAELSTLSAIFDEGKFNCVSSSELYFLVGTRLGLKLCPILIPGGLFLSGHAAIDLIDGSKRIEIEPTNPDGFDWSSKLNKPGVFTIGAQPDRKKGHPCDGFSLASSAASNLALTASKAKPPLFTESVRMSVVALVLSPCDSTAADNLGSMISNRGLSLGEMNKFDEAIKVFAYGAAAIGPHRTLDHNRFVIWHDYLNDVFGSGKIKQGLALLAKASQDFPKSPEFTRPAYWIARAADRIVTNNKENWNEGLKFAEASIKDLSTEHANEVRAWKDRARRYWSQDLLAQGDIAGSLKVIADGLAVAPESKELTAGLRTHTAKALEYLDKSKTSTEVIAHFEELCAKFPKNEDIRTMGAEHVRFTVVKTRIRERKCEDALKASEVYRALAGDQIEDIQARTYDAWALQFVEEGKWEEGLGKFLEGLTVYPKNHTLNNNAIVLIDRWAGLSIDKKNWDEAIRIYDLGLKHFPKDAHLEHNRKCCVESKAK